MVNADEIVLYDNNSSVNVYGLYTHVPREVTSCCMSEVKVICLTSVEWFVDWVKGQGCLNLLTDCQICVYFIGLYVYKNVLNIK